MPTPARHLLLEAVAAVAVTGAVPHPDRACRASGSGEGRAVHVVPLLGRLVDHSEGGVAVRRRAAVTGPV